MTFAARLTVFLIAVGYAWMGSRSQAFRTYLISQGIATVGLFLSEHLLGRSSRAYLWAYFALTLLVLVSGGFLAWSAFQLHKARWLALLAAVGIAIAFDVEAWRHMKGTIGDYIAIGEAGTLIVCAILIGVSAPYQTQPDRMVSLTMALLWIGLAGFRIGYRVFCGEPYWEIANQVVPCVLVSAAIAWCGALMRRVEGIAFPS